MCFPTNVLSLQLKHSDLFCPQATQTRLVRSLHPARMAVSCDGSARYRKKGKKKSPRETETRNPRNLWPLPMPHRPAAMPPPRPATVPPSPPRWHRRPAPAPSHHCPPQAMSSSGPSPATSTHAAAVANDSSAAVPPRHRALIATLAV
jgi:hypothetical protein